MDVREPQKRRRGFFLQSEGGEPDTGDHENAEGFAIRTRLTRSETPRQFSSVRRGPSDAGIEESRTRIRSGSGTGSRQRAHSPR
jgi:hypothetical protein